VAVALEALEKNPAPRVTRPASAKKAVRTFKPR